MLLAVGALVAGTVICLARAGHGSLDSIWAEDGYPFYHDALNGHATHNLFAGHNGYFLVLSRLIAEFVALTPRRLGGGHDVDQRGAVHRGPRGAGVRRELVLLIMVVNLRPTPGPRSVVPSWSAEVAKARTICQTTNARSAPVYFGGDVWLWPVTVQCRRLR
jgi:hypothetical protein